MAPLSSSLRLSSPLLGALAAALCGCATAPAARTVQLRSFLGADDAGGYAFAELSASPGASAEARARVVGADGKEAAALPLPPEKASAAFAAAEAAGEARIRTADQALAGYSLEGFDRAKARPLGPGRGPWDLEPFTGAKARLELSQAEGEAALLALRLEGVPEQLVVGTLPPAGSSWVDSVLVLPGARRMLVLTGSTSRSGKDWYRTEGLAEIDLGAGLAQLLDARAIAAFERKDPLAARKDLEQAVALAPEDATAQYNLACALAQLGFEDEAILALGRAVDLGDERLKRLALSDPDLDPIRERVEFKLMIEPRPGEE